MGRSIGPPEPLPSAQITHEESQSTIAVEFKNGRMIHRLVERGLSAEYPIAYQIGSGRRGRTFAAQIGSYLLESPVSWYRERGWDVSPGYEKLQLIDFDRPVTDNCLFCHAGEAKFSDADGRKLAASNVNAITCERCHGPTEAHVQHPSAKNIVNPAKLDGPQRDGICEQCHLEGETRIVNPGKTMHDYRAGQRLEDTLVTYLYRQRGDERPAVTQVEELAASRCARASGGKLWCGSCHDPHGQVANRNQQIREVCTACHATLSRAAHPASQTECVSCHMPARSTSNIAHVAVTDHWIHRPNEVWKPTETADAVVAWRDPPDRFRQRDLALAKLEIGNEQHVPATISESVKLLQTLPAEQQTKDADVLSNLQAIYLQTSSPQKAVALSQWATEVEPRSATFAMNLGIALKRAGEAAKAEQQLERAIELDPSLMQAYAELAVLYDTEERTEDARKTIDRFLQWNPQSIQFRLARRQ